MSTSAGTRAPARPADSRVAGNGHLPEWMLHRSKLAASLPAIFSEGAESDFLQRYLMIFEEIFNSVEGVVDQLPAYFDADSAPEAFLPWLASWVGLVIDEGWPIERRRAVLANAMDLHRRRGTIRGLKEHIFLYSGYEPIIIERGFGLRLGPRSRLGHQTVLGRGDRPHHFSVILRVPEPAEVDRAHLRTIIEAQRPAHTTYALFVVPLDTAESDLLPENEGGNP